MTKTFKIIAKKSPGAETSPQDTDALIAKLTDDQLVAISARAFKIARDRHLEELVASAATAAKNLYRGGFDPRTSVLIAGVTVAYPDSISAQDVVENMREIAKMYEATYKKT